jgi:TRAP-type C4-dicarboxylate transport system permease small subunit
VPYASAPDSPMTLDLLLRSARGLVAGIRATAAILLAGSVAINFANIIGRYFFSVSIQWAEEIMLFLMIGCVFLGSGAVGWSRRQIRMDAIIAMMPPKARQVPEVIGELIEIATCLFLAVLSWPVVTMLAELDQRSQAANFPLVIPQATMPIGFVLLALLIAAGMVARSRHGASAADQPPGH